MLKNYVLCFQKYFQILAQMFISKMYYLNPKTKYFKTYYIITLHNNNNHRVNYVIIILGKTSVIF